MDGGDGGARGALRGVGAALQRHLCGAAAARAATRPAAGREQGLSAGLPLDALGRGSRGAQHGDGARYLPHAACAPPSPRAAESARRRVHAPPRASRVLTPCCCGVLRAAGGRADLLETLVQPGLPQLQLRGSSAPPACPGGLLSASGSPSGGGSNSGPALASPVQVRTGLPLWEPGFAGAELDAQHPGGSAGKKDLRQYEDLVLKGVSSALPKRRGDKRDVSGSPSQVPSARSRSSPSAKAASTPREPASPRSRESATHAPGAENAAGQDPAEGWRLELDCAWSSIPHPLKVHRGGEDVHIVCRAGGERCMLHAACCCRAPRLSPATHGQARRE